MKITLPRIVRERVGTAYTYPGVDRIYFADDRPNVYKVSEGKAQPIYEPRLQYQTVFDYDFQFIRRSRAAGAIALAAVFGVAMIGVVIPAMATYFLARDWVSSLRETAEDAWDAAGYVIGETGGLIQRLAKVVTNP